MCFCGGGVVVFGFVFFFFFFCFFFWVFFVFVFFFCCVFGVFLVGGGRARAGAPRPDTAQLWRPGWTAGKGRHQEGWRRGSPRPAGGALTVAGG
ncbi:hypothetical protein PUR71_03365, partial [Streptomyces sp. SP17BM10]|uniref:hypothetical protein n=1 Tax=Streptomyces sp. SP17BM10 TaxID=3002530 RepID=UPI002E771791